MRCSLGYVELNGTFVCKVLWGGRWQQDTGGTTGEEVEQINSHFSRLGNSTKHMLPEGIVYCI